MEIFDLLTSFHSDGVPKSVGTALKAFSTLAGAIVGAVGVTLFSGIGLAPIGFLAGGVLVYAFWTSLPLAILLMIPSVGILVTMAGY